MTRFYLANKAKKDLQDIKKNTLKKWGAAQTKKYLQKIREACQRIADNPTIGKLAEDVEGDLLRYATGSHVIFYKKYRRRMYIVTILHERMLPAEHVSGKKLLP